MVSEHKVSERNRAISYILWFFPALFLIEDVLGLNGYQFTIKGISIRHILFCLSSLALCTICILESRSRGIRIFSGTRLITGYFKPIDFFVLGFVLVNFIWATVVPIAVRNDSKYAFKDFQTIIVLIMYFPCVFLLRIGAFPQCKARKLLFGLFVLLALWHIIMYIGDTIKPGFYAGYYDFIDRISLGTAVRTDVIYGFGFIRVIQVTSVFLVPALFLALAYGINGSRKTIVVVLLVVEAIIMTFTRSLWFGTLVGLIVAFIGCMVFDDIRRRKFLFLIYLVLCLSFVVLSNYLFFNNHVFLRSYSTFSQNNGQSQTASAAGDVQHSSSLEEIVASADDMRKLEGIILSDQTRSQQSVDLLNKWKESKLIGFGYGAYIDKDINNAHNPFMYEMTLPALLMKLGIVGLSAWLIFIVALVVFAARRMWQNRKHYFFLWLGNAISFALAVQTNPLLFTFAGMSILLFICVAIEWSEEK